MVRPRILTTALFGDHPLLMYCAEGLLARGHRVVLAVSTPAGIRRWAARRGVPVADESEAISLLPDGLDLLLDVGHPNVPAPVLVARARLAVRFHDGPLPEYAGHHVTTWSLLAGEVQHAVCWHVLAGRGHGGPVVAREGFAITDRDTTADLDARCLAAGVRSFPTLLEAIEGGQLRPEAQNELKRGWYGQHRSPPGAGVLDWRRPAGLLDRTVRALSGGAQSPVAWATMAVGRDAVVVERAHIEARDQPVAPGLVMALDVRGMTVAAGAGALRITRIWRQDGRPLRFTDLPVSIGEILPVPDLAAIEAHDQLWRPDAWFWTRRLREAEPLPLPFGVGGLPEAGGRLVRLGHNDGEVLAAACVLLARAAEVFSFDVAVTDPTRLAAVEGLEAWFSPSALMRVELDTQASLAVAASNLRDAWQVARRTGYRCDLAARSAGRRGPEGGVLIARVEDAARFSPPREVVVACVFDGAHVRWWAPPEILAPLERGFACLLETRSSEPIGRISLLSRADTARIEAINAPASTPTPLRISDVVLARAAATPDAAALTLGEREAQSEPRRALSFAGFEARVNRLARHLQRAGVGRGVRVAVLQPDPGDLMVGVVGVLAAGGVAVPLDAEAAGARLAHMQLDARLDAALTRAPLRERVSVAGPVVCTDAEHTTILAWPADPLPCPAEPEDAACLVFGEASQGAALSHQHLVGLFAGLDEVIEQRPGVWLSLSPPTEAAAVVDALWALSRGFELAPPVPLGERPVSLSLACGASDAGVLAAVARFADRHGFEGLWLLDWGVAGATQPDAAVAAAAVALATDRVALRAVTRVAPEPARQIEIWSMINGLCGGRLGLAARPESLRRLPSALSHLRTVGGGEGPPGLWAVVEDAAGFTEAGRVGAGALVVIGPEVLTHLPAWIALYRAARADAGQAGRGQVTLVVPTLIGEDDATVRAWARDPLASWLVRQNIRDSALLDSLALCGDAPRAAGWLAAAARMGVDEVACLLDFGVPSALIRTHLAGLERLRGPEVHAGALPAQVIQRGVTHLEVPVPRLRRLLSEPGAREALASLQHIVITGESVPADLVRATRGVVGPGVRITRRYGPIEAGTWCTSAELVGDEATVPLGLPVGPARVYVLDGRGEPVPLGAPGELCVGGPALPTGIHPARRVAAPDGAPLLRTGLRVRQALDGVIEPVLPPPPLPSEPPENTLPRPFDGTPLERAAALVVARVMGLAHLPDPAVDLFGRIGDPEVLVRLADALGDALHREVPLAALFLHRSIRELVLHLRSGEPTDVGSGLRGLRKRRRRREAP